MIQRYKYGRRLRPFPLFILAAGLILGWAVKLLWNAILPSLLGVNTITYWQSVGLLLLCRILLGNFGGPGFRPRRHWANHADHDSAEHETNGPFFQGMRWRKKWMGMSDEERIKFRDEMKRRCGKRPGNE